MLLLTCVLSELWQCPHEGSQSSKQTTQTTHASSKTRTHKEFQASPTPAQRNRARRSKSAVTIGRVQTIAKFHERPFSSRRFPVLEGNQIVALMPGLSAVTSSSLQCNPRTRSIRILYHEAALVLASINAVVAIVHGYHRVSNPTVIRR